MIKTAAVAEPAPPVVPVPAGLVAVGLAKAHSPFGLCGATGAAAAALGENAAAAGAAERRFESSVDGASGLK